MKRFYYLTLALLSLGTMAACNTTEGFGQDVEAAGDQIEETARKAKDEITDE